MSCTEVSYTEMPCTDMSYTDMPYTDMPMTDMSQDVKQANMGGIIGLAMGGLEKRGMVYGPGGPKEDKIPAMLSNGEFVMTAKAVELDKIQRL